MVQAHAPAFGGDVAADGVGAGFVVVGDIAQELVGPIRAKVGGEVEPAGEAPFLAHVKPRERPRGWCRRTSCSG